MNKLDVRVKRVTDNLANIFEKNISYIKNERKKKNRGITLIALVLTIIILLILAGVSLNLVAGSKGILNRAKVAANTTNLANIKEELELKIAEMQLDYYSDSSSQSSYATVNTYVKEKFKEGIELSNGVDVICYDDGKLKYDEVEIGTLNSDGTITIDGEFNGGQIVAKYRVTYNANGGTGDVPATAKYDSGKNVTVDFSTKPTKKGCNFLGWATNSNATTPEYTNSESFTINGNVTLYAVWETLLGTVAIEPEFYGDKVNYRANDVSDWQVFLNDGSNVYIISSNHVPNSGVTENLEKSGLYGVHESSRDGLVNWLTTESNWSAYANGFRETIATGGPTLAQFVKSYNQKMDKSYLDTEGQDEGFINNITDILYNPQTDVSKNLNAYWLASASPRDPGLMWDMSSNLKNLMHHAYYCTAHGIRPLVKLPADAKMSWNGTAWDLSK